jgi:hypothetical protein
VGEIEAARRFLNHPKGKQEDGGRNDKMNLSRVAQAAFFAYTKTPFWVYARASLRPRIPTSERSDVFARVQSIRKREKKKLKRLLVRLCSLHVPVPHQLLARLSLRIGANEGEHSLRSPYVSVVLNTMLVVTLDRGQRRQRERIRLSP